MNFFIIVTTATFSFIIGWLFCSYKFIHGHYPEIKEFIEIFGKVKTNSETTVENFKLRKKVQELATKNYNLQKELDSIKSKNEWSRVN